jgi:hypothetical protein
MSIEDTILDLSTQAWKDIFEFSQTVPKEYKYHEAQLFTEKETVALKIIDLAVEIINIRERAVALLQLVELNRGAPNAN